MANYNKVSPGQPLEFPADVYNRLLDLLGESGTPSQSGKPTKFSPRIVTLIKIGVAASGANLYEGKFLAFASVVIQSTNALSVDDFFGSALAAGDCIIADWPNVGQSGHSLEVGTILPAAFSGWTKHGEKVLPLFHLGGGGGSLPVGEFQHMVYGMISDNQGGFFFPMAHDIPE